MTNPVERNFLVSEYPGVGRLPILERRSISNKNIVLALLDLAILTLLLALDAMTVLSCRLLKVI
jgi:hypothetical protein